MHVFGQWEEAGVPGENPRIHGENMPTPQGKAPAGVWTKNPLAVKRQRPVIKPVRDPSAINPSLFKLFFFSNLSLLLYLYIHASPLCNLKRLLGAACGVVVSTVGSQQEGSRFKSHLCPFCVEFVSSPCACMTLWPRIGVSGYRNFKR